MLINIEEIKGLAQYRYLELYFADSYYAIRMLMVMSMEEIKGLALYWYLELYFADSSCIIT